MEVVAAKEKNSLTEQVGARKCTYSSPSSAFAKIFGLIQTIISNLPPPGSRPQWRDLAHPRPPQTDNVLANPLQVPQPEEAEFARIEPLIPFALSRSLHALPVPIWLDMLKLSRTLFVVSLLQHRTHAMVPISQYPSMPLGLTLKPLSQMPSSTQPLLFVHNWLRKL